MNITEDFDHQSRVNVGGGIYGTMSGPEVEAPARGQTLRFEERMVDGFLGALTARLQDQCRHTGVTADFTAGA